MLKPSSPTATVPVSPPQSRCSSTVTAESRRRLPAPLSRPCVAVSTTTGTTIELRLSVPLFVVVTLADSVHPRIRLTLPPDTLTSLITVEDCMLIAPPANVQVDDIATHLLANRLLGSSARIGR